MIVSMLAIEIKIGCVYETLRILLDMPLPEARNASDDYAIRMVRVL